MDLSEEQIEQLGDALRVAGFESDPDEDNDQLATLAEVVLDVFDYDRLRAEVEAPRVPDGWRFHSADFSVQASGKDYRGGIVTLVRAPAEKARWHQMPDEMKEDESGPPLYVIGRGLTLADAFVDAKRAARAAAPVPIIVAASSGGEAKP